MLSIQYSTVQYNTLQCSYILQYLYVPMSLCIYLCIYVSMYVCMSICMYLCTCLYLSLFLFLTLFHFHSFVYQAIALMTRHQRQRTLPYKTSWNLFKFYNCYQTLSYCNACIVNRHKAVSTKIDLELASCFLDFVTFLTLHISEDVYFVFWILFFWILYKIGGQTDRHIYSQSNNQKDRQTHRLSDTQSHRNYLTY